MPPPPRHLRARGVCDSSPDASPSFPCSLPVLRPLRLLCVSIPFRPVTGPLHFGEGGGGSFGTLGSTHPPIHIRIHEADEKGKSVEESVLMACLGGKKIALRGGDGTEAHLPNPPLPLLGRRAGRGVWAGAALPAVPGGGGEFRPQHTWLKMIPTSR